MQAWLNIQKLINIIYYLNRIKEKNILKMRSFRLIQTKAFMIKIQTYLINGLSENLQLTSGLKVILGVVSLKPGTKQGCLL